MPKKEGRIVARGINPQGVLWIETSYIEDKEEDNKKRERKLPK
jgi:hypothetical protein